MDPAGGGPFQFAPDSLRTGDALARGAPRGAIRPAGRALERGEKLRQPNITGGEELSDKDGFFSVGGRAQGTFLPCIQGDGWEKLTVCKQGGERV
ncbi:hypothetical protein J31TS4_18320 [Paenibacillus sp. J31TS4]|nr:hypothetical protein J31TS4_18320 [Paenibacillus sp. J31TS4]